MRALGGDGVGTRIGGLYCVGDGPRLIAAATTCMGMRLGPAEEPREAGREFGEGARDGALMGEGARVYEGVEGCPEKLAWRGISPGGIAPRDGGRDTPPYLAGDGRRASEPGVKEGRWRDRSAGGAHQRFTVDHNS